jgi:hypothetical protein
MATLIVFPDPGYNTFVSLAEADAIAENYLLAGEWQSMRESKRELYLLEAFRTMHTLEGFTDPVNDAGCLKTAQCEIAFHDAHFGISTSDPSEAQIARQKAGPVEVEYFEKNGGSTLSKIPATAWDCLKNYGATPPRAFGGIGSIGKTRL